MSGGFSAEIGVTAKVDGAIGPLTQVADATDKIATASEAAGAAQASLSKQVNASTAANKEAAAALAKVRLAADEAALTARAFGAESREAAESQARLTRAMEAAKVATAAEKAELEQTKLGLAKVSAEADKVSPALKRAADSTEKLTAAQERNAAELKKLELQQTANARASSKGAGGFDLLGAAGGKLMSVLGPAALGASLMSAASWLGDAAEKTLQYETALRNLPFGIQAAQAATHGLVGTQALAVSASQAVALGVVKTQDEFNQLASDASKIALKLGVSSEAMLGDLTTALGRGSAMILDNAGIILKVSDANEAYAKAIGKTVSELNEMEKKTAFQIAAMKAIRESADATTVAYDGQAAAISRASVQWGNFTDSLERGASNAFGSVLVAAEDSIDRLTEFGVNAQAAAEITARWNDEAEDAPITISEWAVATVRLSDAYQGLTGFLGSDVWRKAAEDQAALSAETSKAADFAERQNKAYAKLLADQEAHLDAQALASITYGPALPPKADKKKAGKKAEAFDTNETVAAARIADGRDETNAIALEAGIIDRSNAAAAEAAAIEENIATRERSIAAIDREVEAREAAGLAFDDLQAQRFEQERELQDYTVRNIQDRNRQEEAQTRFAKQQHDKRLRDLRATAAAEKKEHDKREAQLQTMSGAVENFGNALVTAMEAEEAGAKGAFARSIATWLKGIRNQMLVKGAVETALAVASAASLNPVGAAAHGTAAGLAFGAAAAAGIAGAAIGASVSGGDGGGAGAGGGGFGSAASGGAARPPASSSSGSSEVPERQTVPVSYEQTRRDLDKPAPTSEQGASGQVINHWHIGMMATDERKLGAEFERMRRKAPREGKRF
jgi:hypothetical protein